MAVDGVAADAVSCAGAGSRDGIDHAEASGKCVVGAGDGLSGGEQ